MRAAWRRRIERRPGKREHRRRLASALAAVTVSGLLLGVLPVPQLTAPAGADVVLDLVKAGLLSLYNSSNSYECYQNPSTPKCQMGGIGDLFRFFGSTEQKERIEILQQLAVINQKLDDIKRTTDEIRATVDISYLDQKLNELRPSLILQTMQIFNFVVQTCEGKSYEFLKTNATCKEWLTERPQPGAFYQPNEFYKGHLGQLIDKNIASKTPQEVLASVRGNASLGGGLYDALAKVASDNAAKKYFFTATDTKIIQAYFAYVLTAELAYITLWSNYWQAYPPSGIDVMGTRNDFIKGVQDQFNRFTQLPSGTTVDMRTGLMWSTNNSCLVNSLQSPAVCGISQIAGFPLTAVCPPVTSGPCQLKWPLVTEDEDQALSWINTARDTAPQSSWKVPTPQQVSDLLRDRGSDGAAFLRNNAQLYTNSEYTWTSTMWCPRFLRNPANYLLCLNGNDSRSPPLRVSFNITTGASIDNKANACNGGPCRAVYIFVRRPTAAEYNASGIVQRWP